MLNVAANELGAQRNRLRDELSGGQRQRVALVRAVFGPDVILMDESLGALDRRLRQTLQREIARIHQELRPTVIYVTHDQEEALALSTRIAVMRHGGIEHIGSPREIYDRPATVFAATFVGETNLLELEVGRVTGDGRAGSSTPPSGSRLVLNVDRAALGEHLTVAIRPEQLEVLVPRPAAACVFRDGLGSTPSTDEEQRRSNKRRRHRSGQPSCNPTALPPGRRASSGPTISIGCVATDIDPDSTFVGGARSLIEGLLADTRVEAMPIDD